MIEHPHMPLRLSFQYWSNLCCLLHDASDLFVEWFHAVSHTAAMFGSDKTESFFSDHRFGTDLGPSLKSS